MKNFIFGVLSTFGIFALCGKMYDKGRQSVIEEQKEDTQKKTKKQK